MPNRQGVWVLTCDVNDYRQYGKYFLGAWNHKPTVEEIKGISFDDCAIGEVYAESLVSTGHAGESNSTEYYLEEE